jgi:chromosome segregation ATPase
MSLLLYLLAAMEEAVLTGEILSNELQLARTEAAANKEETNGVRKRLAGCHFHYKELQQHYDAMVKQNEELERRLGEAEEYEALHNNHGMP